MCPPTWVGGAENVSNNHKIPPPWLPWLHDLETRNGNHSCWVFLPSTPLTTELPLMNSLRYRTNVGVAGRGQNMYTHTYTPSPVVHYTTQQLRENLFGFIQK